MKRKNIGFVISETDGYYMSQVISGAAKAAERLDVNLFIFPAKYLHALRKDQSDPKRRFEYQNNVLLQYAGVESIDGLVIGMSSIGYAVTKERQKEVLDIYKNIPVMLLSSEEEGCYSISCDNRDGWSEGIRYILDKAGRKKVGIVSGPSGHCDSDQRMETCIDIVKSRGLTLTESQIVHVEIDGYFVDEVDEMLTRHPDIDALFCVNDAIATNVYDIVKKHNLVIGKDISILGFDNKDGTEKYDPPLATVDADASVLGEKSVEYMAAIIGGEDIPSKVVIDTSFVLRESAGLDLTREKTNFDTTVRMNYAETYFQMIRRNRQLCATFRNVLNFEREGNLIFSRFIESFDDNIFSDALLYLLDGSVKHTNDTDFQIPHWMNLVAYRQNGYVTALESNNRVVTDVLFRNKYYADKRGTYVVMAVYAREKQYGLLVCNMNPDAFYAQDLIGYQAGVVVEFAGYFNDRNKLLSELRYENERLDSMSYKDELTGISNRRGFTQDVNKLLVDPENKGKNLVALYCDLNYLKLINDKFGHLEGDFAIQKVACAIEYCCSDYESVIGRIGGDEFVGFVIADPGEGENIKRRIYEYMSDYNSLKEHKYNITVSAGVYEVSIDNKVNLVEIMDEADKVLYEEKRKKGPFIISN